MSNTWIICIDGTWNMPGQTDDDPIDHREAETKTNVQILWETLTQKNLIVNDNYGSIEPLVATVGAACYINGVGSSGSQHWRNFEGTTGTGTSERIMDAYRFLAERWQFGDRIMGFGFSRGAFAVRSLMGFIDYVGLPRHPRLLGDAELFGLFESYRDKPTTYAMPNTMQVASIDFVGVWDTVGALAFGEKFNHFHELSPSNIQHICQALALDEQRKEFLPEYFKPTSPTQRVEEVWFAGAHSNVGGGYVDANLSNIALFWLLHKLALVGINIDLTRVPGWVEQNPEGERRNSYEEFWNSMSVGGELIEKHKWQKVRRTVYQSQKISASVMAAMTKGYAPAAITDNGAPINTWATEPKI